MKLSLSNIYLFLIASAVMGSGVGYSKLYLFHVALAFFLFSFFYYAAYNHQTTFFFPRNGFIYFLFCMFLWYALGIVWSIEPLYGLNYLFYLTIGILLVILICAYAIDRRRYSKVFRTLAIFFIIALVLALLESFTSFRLPTSPYSEYASLFDRIQIDLSQFDSSDHALIKSSPTAFWGNPNNLAIAMVMIAPFFLMENRIAIKLGGTVAVLLTIAMTGSRGAFIGFLVGLCVFVLVKGVRFWLPILIISFSCSMFLAENMDTLKHSELKRVSELASSGEVLLKYLSEDVESNDSIGYRQQLIKNGLDELWKTGGLGVGGGGSVAVQERSSGDVGKLGSMHNFWIEMLVDAGVLFFVLFLVWYMTIAFKLLGIHKASKDIFFKYHAGSLFVTFISFTVAAVSASSVIYFLPMWLMFGLAIALISIYKNEYSLPRKSYIISKSTRTL